MSSLQGFRCRRCRTELLARPPAGNGDVDATTWTPPILCCDQPLRRLPADQIVAAVPSHGRQASCLRCGYSVRIVVHPTGALVCAVCRQELQTPAEALPRVSAEDG